MCSKKEIHSKKATKKASQKSQLTQKITQKRTKNRIDFLFTRSKEIPYAPPSLKKSFCSGFVAWSETFRPSK